MIWDVSPSDVLVYDNTTPNWFDAQKSAMISTFKSWDQVVDWALNLYEFEAEQLADLWGTRA